MRYAIFEENRATATPNDRGLCPGCGAGVMAKCGELVAWHWSHLPGVAECDSWYEPMTEWHLGWQDEVPESWREVVIGSHRADIRMPSGIVIEVQHSSISTSEISAREDFYNRMMWIFDVADAFDGERLEIRGGTFLWSHAWKSLAACRRPLVLDIGDGRCFLVEKFNEGMSWGAGRIVRSAELAEWMRGEKSLDLRAPSRTRAPGEAVVITEDELHARRERDRGSIAFGRWLIAGTLVSEPYPCKCRSGGGCWERCECRGRMDMETMPEWCCGHLGPLVRSLLAL